MQRPVCRPRGFTLVELLVVMLIILVLISLLLPAINKVRDAGNLAVCASNLGEIGKAMFAHAADHDGYAATSDFYTQGGTPADAQDFNQQRFDYFNDSGVLRIAPLPAALAKYMGVHMRFNSLANLQADLFADTPATRVFRCPGQQDLKDWHFSYETGATDPTGPRVFSSYIVNVGVVSPRRQYDPSGLQTSGRNSKLTAMPRAAETLMMCDGMNETEFGVFPYGPLEIWPQSSNTTLMDVWRKRVTGFPGTDDPPCDTPAARDAGVYSVIRDIQRHHFKMNVLFVDGHVGTYNTPTSATDGRTTDMDHVLLNPLDDDSQ